MFLSTIYFGGFICRLIAPMKIIWHGKNIFCHQNTKYILFAMANTMIYLNTFLNTAYRGMIYKIRINNSSCSICFTILYLCRRALGTCFKEYCKQIKVVMEKMGFLQKYLTRVCYNVKGFVCSKCHDQHCLLSLCVNYYISPQVRARIHILITKRQVSFV